MSRRAVTVALLVVTAVAMALLLLAPPRPGGASTLSPTAHGWLAARRYLEERAAPVDLRSKPWEAGALPDVMAIGFPAHRTFSRDELEALRGWLEGGGVLVLGYSGGVPGLAEATLLRALDLDPHDVGGRPPASPRRWREHVDRAWRLLPEPSAPARLADLQVRALRFVPRARPGASVLFRAPGDVAAVYEVPRGRGRVLVLPAEALSNARLGQPGHADLLEWLWATHPGRWSFDEYHHGLGVAAAGPASRAGETFDAFLLQLVLLYLAALLAVVRRFGPAWDDPPLQAASTATFLRGLGVQHDARRHHASAAALLVARAQALQPWLKPPDAVAHDGRSLVALAREVGRRQGGA